MNDLGVRFLVNDIQQFELLRSLLLEIKKDKDAQAFREPTEWTQFVPDVIKANFYWPTEEERTKWLTIRDSVPIAISAPVEQLGAQWDFYRIFESIEESEYELLDCVMADSNVGELRIDAYSYPYGGVGALIALAEAYGFTVLGVNECGMYESREQLLN